MPLLNYTSKVRVETSIAEIHAMLLRAKATDITTKYAQPSGKPVGIALSIETPGGVSSALSCRRGWGRCSAGCAPRE